jgi:hypothetical protein
MIELGFSFVRGLTIATAASAVGVAVKSQYSERGGINRKLAKLGYKFSPIRTLGRLLTFERLVFCVWVHLIIIFHL